MDEKSVTNDVSILWCSYCDLHFGYESASYSGSIIFEPKDIPDVEIIPALRRVEQSDDSDFLYNGINITKVKTNSMGMTLFTGFQSNLQTRESTDISGFSTYMYLSDLLRSNMFAKKMTYQHACLF